MYTCVWSERVKKYNRNQLSSASPNYQGPVNSYKLVSFSLTKLTNCHQRAGSNSGDS